MKTAHRNTNNQRFGLGKTLTATLYLTLALLALPAYAVTNELVGSAESHSIEKFDSSGNWIKTFASTGPYYPVGIAVSPLTGDVFAATMTEIILRYAKGGAPLGQSGSYWDTFNMEPQAGGNPLEALLFDPNGDLYVATNYGESSAGYTVKIFRYPAKQLTKQAPQPVGLPIITTIEQAGQMAWDANQNLCIASWYSPQTVQCFKPGTGALVVDYASEIQAQHIQPLGLAFGPGNILTVSSLFTGEVYTEAVAGVGPMNLLATGSIQPAEVGFLAVDSSGNLYLPEWHNVAARYGGAVPYFCTYYSCQDYDTSSDMVYEINPTSGTQFNFVQYRLWGPYQMIFVPF
jgi:DNA-binding beta-propeller fold protein YncE